MCISLCISRATSPCIARIKVCAYPRSHEASLDIVKFRAAPTRDNLTLGNGQDHSQLAHRGCAGIQSIVTKMHELIEESAALPANMIPWTKITHFGDIAITSIAAIAIAGWLLAEKEKRLSLCWSLLFVIGLALVTATKIAFIGWGIGIASIDFTGFSGHAMRAASVMPVLAYLLSQRAARPMRIVAVAFGYGFAILIGISRLAVHAHSPSEVVAGWILGVMISAGFILIAGSMRSHVFNPLRIVMILLVLLPAPYVQPAPTQQWLTDMSLFFSGRRAPYMRTSQETCTPARQCRQFDL